MTVVPPKSSRLPVLHPRSLIRDGSMIHTGPGRNYSGFQPTGANGWMACVDTNMSHLLQAIFGGRIP